MNCAGLTETLLESELFGHVKGSFTGAYRDKPGKLAAGRRRHAVPRRSRRDEPAHAGAAAAFPRERRSPARSASERPRPVDVRIIAATNRNLAERVAAGEFREDLLYRLRVIHIHVPPLRDRRADIRPLIEHFASRRARPGPSRTRRSSSLLRYRWPGNVRELQNIVEQAVWQSGTTEIGPEHLPTHMRVARERFVHDARAAAPGRRRAVRGAGERAATRSGRTSIRCSFRATSPGTTSASWSGAGCRTTRGSYRGSCALFSMQPQDYQRFHNFLTAHGCKVEFREFRNGDRPLALPRRVLDPLAGADGGARHGRDTRV